MSSNSSMSFYCSNDKGFRNFASLKYVDAEYDSIIGINYSEYLKTFIIIYNRNKDLNVFVFDQESIQDTHIKNCKLYDSISKYDPQLSEKINIISLKSILYTLIPTQIKDTINFKDYHLKCENDRKLDLILWYYNMNIKYEFKLVTISGYDIVTEKIKNNFKVYFSECLNVIQFINSENFKKYVELLKFITFSFNKLKPATLNYKKIITSILELDQANAFKDLSWFFLNDWNNDITNSIYDKFVVIQNMCQNRTLPLTGISIPCKNLNIHINKTYISYKIANISFNILLSDYTKCIQFINVVKHLNKLEILNNELEKIILLKC
jgi:hypothetical protein